VPESAWIAIAALVGSWVLRVGRAPDDGEPAGNTRVCELTELLNVNEVPPVTRGDPGPSSFR